MTTRVRNSKHGRVSKKMKKASRFMMTTMRRGYQYDQQSKAPGGSYDMAQRGFLSSIGMVALALFGAKIRGGRR